MKNLFYGTVELNYEAQVKEEQQRPQKTKKQCVDREFEFLDVFWVHLGVLAVVCCPIRRCPALEMAAARV